MIKVKSFIYRVFGIYLAHKEENDFMNSDEYWEDFERLSKVKEQNGLEFSHIHGIIIGSWQAKNKFYTSMNSLRWRFYFWKLKIFKKL